MTPEMIGQAFMMGRLVDAMSFIGNIFIRQRYDYLANFIILSRASDIVSGV